MIDETDTIHSTTNSTSDIRVRELEADNARLMQQVSLLTSILNALPQAIFWKDTNLTFQGANRALAAVAGYDNPDDLVGKTDYDLPCKPEEAAFFRECDQRIMDTDTPEYNIVEPILNAQHEQRWLRTSKIPLHADDGSVMGVLGMFEDITDSKQLEESLKESEYRYQNMFERATIGMFRSLPDGKLVDANNAAAHMIGYESPAEVIDSLTDLGTQLYSSLDERTRVLEALRRNQGRAIVEARFRRRDGSIMIGKLNIWVVMDDQGNAKFMEGFIEDITDQKRVEEELRVFKALIENAPDAIGIATPDATITYANPAFRRLCGYDDDLIGLDFHQIYPEHDHAALDETVTCIIEQGSWQGKQTWLNKDGQQVPVLTSAFLLTDDAGTPVAMPAIFHDLTVMQQIEQERALLQEQMIETQQMAIRELSSPLLPLADNVLALPLVGTVDSTRAQLIMETLLEGIAESHAELAIVDITGLKVVDTQVAQALVQTAQAVRLLGAQIVLTGIQPQIAQTLVHMGADLSGVVTRSTLQSGIAYAMGERRNGA